MTRYWYWIGYTARSGSNLSFNGAEMWADHRISTAEDVEGLRQELSGQLNAAVTVLAVSPLRTDVVSAPESTTAGH